MTLVFLLEKRSRSASFAHFIGGAVRLATAGAPNDR